MSTVPVYTGDVPKRTQSQTAFNQNVQDILDYQVTLAPAINTVADEINTNATNAATSESNAATSETNAQTAATEAAASANATAYDNGTTYDYPDTVIFTDGNTYRCLGVGIIGEDPNDSVNWIVLTLAGGVIGNYPSTLPTFGLDADLGLIGFDVERAGEQTYIDVAGNVQTMGSDLLLAGYLDGRKSLEIFEERENLVLWSEDFSNGAWDGGATVNTNVEVSPDGTNSADEIVSVVGGSYRQQDKPFLSGDNITASVFVKENNSQSATLRVVGGSNPLLVYNFLTNSITDTSGTGDFKFEKLNNGWVRLSIVYVAVADGDVRLRLHGGDVGSPIDGDNVFAWGAQLENAPNASPYMPTTTVPVTRPATNVTKDISKVFNPSEGTFVVEFENDGLIGDSNPAIFRVGSGVSNYFRLQFLDASQIEVKHRVGGAVRSEAITAPVGKVRFSCSYSTLTGELSISVNGSEPDVDEGVMGALDTTGVIAIGFNSAAISGYMNSKIYNLKYIPKASTDAELIALSTLGGE
jgi:hypothetical protein